jgi:adenosylmethionine-8-amino-7-oxononanoate aminotransferase
MARARRWDRAAIARRLAPCRDLPGVVDVRVLGAIGAAEVSERIDLKRVGAACLAAGCFIRPFGRIVYLIPAFIIGAAELARLCAATVEAVARGYDDA